MEINSIWNRDCLDILPLISDKSIDLICIDPPYNINYGNQEWDKKEISWPILFVYFKRVLKDSGNLIIFQGWSNVGKTIDEGKKSFYLKNWIIWDRIKGRGAKTNFVSTREDILWFIKEENSEYKYNKLYSNIKKKTKGMGCKNGQENRALTNIWYDISPIVPWSKERVDHPTQKPEQLINRIVNIFSDENDLVLDCFAGSGTTAICAKNLKRNYIAIEKELAYFNIIKNRLGLIKEKIS